MYLLAIHGSPRKKGNTEIFLDAFISGLDSSFFVEKVRLADLRFAPCLGCNKCEITGKCILEDDFSILAEKILRADIIVVSTPVYFYNHTSLVQAFYERFQVFWVRKNILKMPHPFNKTPLGILLAIGATRGNKLFDSLKRSFRYVLDSIYGIYGGGLFLRGIEKKGEILKFPQYLEEARELARYLKSIL